MDQRNRQTCKGILCVSTLSHYTHTHTQYICFFPSNLLSSPFFSLPPSRTSGPGLHNIRLFPPLPATVRALHFYREKISAISSLVDSRRMLTHAINRRSQQLILVLFCCFFANEFKISPRRDSNSRTNTIDSSIRGLPLVHRGDRLRSLQVTIKTNLFGRASAPSTELNI